MIRFINEKTLRFLQSEETGLKRGLYDFDLSTGASSEVRVSTVEHDESTMSKEEKLRRERLRMLHTGVTSYQQSGDVVLVPIGNDLFVRRGNERTFQKILPDGALKGSIVNPQLSGDGHIVTFVNDSEVFVVSAVRRVSFFVVRRKKRKHHALHSPNELKHRNRTRNRCNSLRITRRPRHTELLRSSHRRR